jgi:UDP-N-acetylmuramyl pentapeptide phosphotransferase/UDP-N-acetylglucosamine-1-phosphate transferase
VNPEKIYILPGFLAAFVITYISIPSIIKVAHTKNLFDEPGERTVHENAVPTLGGLAVFAGFTISVLTFCEIIKIPELPYIVAGLVVIFFIGLKDDILIIAPLTKLWGQIFAALIIVFFTDLRLDNFHGFFGITHIPYFVSVGLTIFTIIVIINGFNLIDGIDGLSASVSSLVSITLGVWFFLSGNFQYSLISFVLTGSLLAFLRFNLFGKNLKIFLGDTGSLINGWVISILVIKFNQLNINHDFKFTIYGSPAVSFGILIVPLYDTIRVMFIRIVKRKSIFSPDKQHIHHVLLSLGMSHKKAVLLLCVINLFFTTFVFYFHNLFGIRTLLLMILFLAMVIFYIPSYLLEKINKKRKNGDF